MKTFMIVVALVLVVVLLVSCLPRGRADLPNVPTRAPGAAAAVVAPDGEQARLAPGLSGGASAPAGPGE